MARKLSLAYLTIFDADPVSAVRIAAETGYDMVGLRLLPSSPGEVLYPLMTDDALLREVAVALRDTGVEMGDVEIARLGAQTDVAAFTPFFERAARLRARHVLVAGDDPDERRLADSFAALARLAASFDLTVDLEFMPWTQVRDLAAARRIVEAAGEPNGGVLVDALHWDRAKSTAAEVRDLPRNRVNYVQLCDGPAHYDPSDEGLIAVARGARLNPGEGGIDLHALAAAIPADATVSVEVPNRERAQTVDARRRAADALAATRAILAGR
ncbi:MAG: sugar phosphate isomerase/epimerase family protein [Alphaproteobacteria bacterium]